MKRGSGGGDSLELGLDRVLGELEQEVMKVLWDRRAASVREVLDELNAERSASRQLAYTTVMTVMSRLVEKGALDRRMVGKAHVYRATQTRNAFLASASDELARQLVADFGDIAIASFVSVLQNVAPRRLERLRARSKRRD